MRHGRRRPFVVGIGLQIGEYDPALASRSHVLGLHHAIESLPLDLARDELNGVAGAQPQPLAPLCVFILAAIRARDGAGGVVAGERL